MLFSVVVPVYNVEKYVAVCIESIIKQTCTDWELILVNDGSTDESERICQTYCNKYENIFIFTKENGGLADSRNYGIDKAKGEYLIFVDSDDYIDPLALEMCEEICKKYNSDLIISEGMREVYKDYIGGYKHWNAEDFQGFDGYTTMIKTMKIAPNWSSCGKCFKKSFWDEKGFRFEKGRLAEDFQLIDKVILEANKIYMVPTFYFYRKFRDNSIMTSVSKKLIEDEILDLIDRENFLKEKLITGELLMLFRKIHAGFYCSNILPYMYKFEGEEKRYTLTQVKTLTFLLGEKTSKKVKYINLIYKCFGLHITCNLLGFIKKNRIKLNSMKRC